MNSGEARVIREVAQKAAKGMPVEAESLMKRAGVYHEIAELKAKGVDPTTVEIVGKDAKGQPVKEGDKVTLTLSVSIIHEKIDPETGQVVGYSYSLDFVKPNGFRQHLGNFDGNLIVKA